MMFKFPVVFILLLLLTTVSAQDARQYYEKGLELAQQGKAEEALTDLDTSIALNDNEYLAWYNRGIVKTMLHRYEDALPDFEEAIRLSPAYRKAYLNRATTKKHLTDYDGAMQDYNYVIKLDSINGEAFYDRGLLYNLLGNRVPACLDFEHALQLGYKNAKPMLERCYQRPGSDTAIHSILYLTKTALNDQYGFTETDPVKVGNGPEGGPANARMYLDLLRDANGKPIPYTRIGPCCSYESKHALIGKLALQDKYEITYTDAEGIVKKAFIYTTYYDYEEPMILKGFKTPKPPKGALIQNSR